MKQVVIIICLSVFSLQVSALSKASLREVEISNLIQENYYIGPIYQQMIDDKIKTHITQSLRIYDVNKPVAGSTDLTPFMKSLAIFDPQERKLLDMFTPYCETAKSPYGVYCMGSDIYLTNWMMVHKNYYAVMKEIIIKWVSLLDTKGSVDALTDFSKIQKKYNLSNQDFIPLVAFIGLDDNGVQYDRLLELFLKNNDLKNYSRYFGLLLDLKTIDRDLPEFAMATISYSLRTGTSRVLINRPGQKKTYKDFSLLGVACLAMNAKISKQQILSTTKLMTSGYELSKIKDWTDDEKKDPKSKIMMHIEDAKKRVLVIEDIISKAAMCTHSAY